MDHRTDNTLELITPFTLRRPESTERQHTEKTLCALLDEGFHESHVQAFKALIQPAAHFCRSCGRSAVREINVCNPAKL